MNKFNLLIVLMIFPFKQSVTLQSQNYQYFYDPAPIQVSVTYPRKGSVDLPVIQPNVLDITLNYTANYNLKCSHTWLSADPLFSKNLYIINSATEKDVGEYVCVNTDGVKQFDMNLYTQRFATSSIYVFVNDPFNKLVPMVSEYAIIQFKITIIPCKPTSKNIQVQLIKERGNFRLVIINYNPMYGFEILSLYADDYGYYQCIADNNIRYQNRFNLTVYSDQIISQQPTSPDVKGSVFKGERIILYCAIMNIIPNWDLPNNNIAVKENRAEVFQINEHFSKLVIDNADPNKDQGEYICRSDYKGGSLRIKIINRNETYVNTMSVVGKYILDEKTKNITAIWIIPYQANYDPDFIWLDSNEKEIEITERSNKYIINKTKTHFTFQINNVEILDSGNYTMKVGNGIDDGYKMQLVVFDKPTVSMTSILMKENQEIELNCSSIGYPTSIITWTYSSCSIIPQWPNCNLFNPLLIGYSGFQIISSVILQANIKFTPTGPMKVTCSAQNAEGEDNTHAYIMITDLNEPFEVFIIDSPNQFFVNDSLTIVCAISAYNSSGDLEWYRDNKPVKITNNIIISRNDTKYSYRKTIFFRSISVKDAGTYECRGSFINQIYEGKSISVIVSEPLAPTIEKFIFPPNVVTVGDQVRFQCTFLGLPIPLIQWYKNDDLITMSNVNVIYSNNTILDIISVKEEDSGSYKCIGLNRFGSDYTVTSLKIKSKVLIRLLAVGISVMISFIILFIIIYMGIRKRKPKRKEYSLCDLLNGNGDQIIPDLPFDQQIDLLPYNVKYEFPRDQLVLGPKIGEGIFGIVFKGLATKIVSTNKNTIVAVKTIKGNADNEMLRKFVSDLKIMIHVGQHLNIVNVLGAITQDIVNNKMMIITEYCRYGNLSDFLFNGRENFVDQINPGSDQIDHRIVTTMYKQQNSDNLTLGQPKTNYVEILYNTGAENATDFKSSSQSECVSNSSQCNPKKKSNSEDNEVENKLTIEAWNSNCTSDDIASEFIIKTSDLVSWGFQVASGMEYLTIRKVLHGDLAARNVLLCDNNVVKICDFGLARSLYKNGNYKKEGKPLLFARWLAIESIIYGIFSQYSDIWAFGIFLWELFSLSKVPYPGMAADDVLYYRLLNGYRMEKPDFANQEIYNLMFSCWNLKPEARPLFSEIVTRLESMLEDGVKTHHHNLNQPYVRTNPEMMSHNQSNHHRILEDQIVPTYKNKISI